MGDEDRLDLAFTSAPSRRSNSATGTPAPQATSITSTSRPSRSAISTQRCRELAEARHQHLVAGVQRVGDRRFPRAGAGTGEDEDLARRGAHHALEVGKQAQRQIAEIRGAHVLLPTFIARRTSSGTLVGPGMNRWV
jgi:hypothetical protein